MTPTELFKENGFVLFKNVLSSEEITKFRNECEHLVKQSKDVLQGDTDHIRNNVLVRSDLILKTFLQTKVVEKIEQVCGKNFLILPEISIMQSQYGGWHKDTTSIELFGHSFHKKDDFNVVNVAIYCQDNGELGGGLDVVPGSHKSDDSFVEHYKKISADTKKQEKPQSALQKAITYVMSKCNAVLVKIRLREAKEPKRFAKGTITYPLASSDKRPGKFTIPTTKGDIVIFDLRMDHKASWPKTEFDPFTVPNKYAFFAICGANNATTQEYIQYLKERSQTQDSYKYLVNYKASPELKQMAEAHGVQAV